MRTGDGAAVAARLSNWLRQELPQARDLEVSGLRRVGGGMSTENWLFDARWRENGRDVAEPMVLRCAARGEIVATTREHEFLLLRALAGRGLASPRALWMDAAGRQLGRPAMLLERLPGRAERAMLSERNALGLELTARARIAQEMVDALAMLHAVNVAQIPHLTQSADPTPALRELALQADVVQREGFGQEPELVLTACWLRSHLPPAPVREVVVHGDWRPANMLVHEGRLSAVLDWELAHRGDPAEDLGWYLADVYRHEHFIPGAWSRADFLARYSMLSGLEVNPRALRFWSVFALYKLAVIAFNSARAVAAGDAARLGPPADRVIEALMRSLCEEPV